MIEIITVSLLITAYIIFDDIICSATLKMNTPPTAQQLHLGWEEDDEEDDGWEEYCDYRMNKAAQERKA